MDTTIEREINTDRPAVHQTRISLPSSRPFFAGTTLLSAFSYLVCFTIAATLLYSSYFHLKNPYAFLVSITRYGLLNSTLASWLAIALPWWQLTLAFALTLRHWPRVTTLLTAILLSAFTFAQVSAVTRGLEIGCGCFGVVGEEKITVFTATRVGVLCGLAWLMCGIEFWNYARQPSTSAVEAN